MQNGIVKTLEKQVKSRLEKKVRQKKMEMILEIRKTLVGGQTKSTANFWKLLRYMVKIGIKSINMSVQDQVLKPDHMRKSTLTS